MQKIQKFQFGHIYRATKTPKTYELLDRSGHHLTFRVRNPKTKDSWKQTSTSTYKADLSGAIDAVNKLREKYDVHILSTAPWDNPSAWSDKLNWVKQYLDPYFTKRLILCHHKERLRGAYLIDDREKHGANIFPGNLLGLHPMLTRRQQVHHGFFDFHLFMRRYYFSPPFQLSLWL